jgi:deoxyribodipyrimidine photolyase-related protein
MKKYYDKLKKKFKTTYINYNEVDKFYKSLEGDITYMDTADLVLNAKLDKLKIKQIDTINFLISPSEFETIKSLIFKKRYSHKEFYKYQKTKLNILEGEKSYDSENRSPLDHVVPKLPKFKSNKYIKEAIIYVEENFSDNYGSLDNFIFPIDHKTSVKWLNEFLEKRLNKFGKYEDSVSKDLFIYHSAISPMMNVGLLTDSQVVAIASNYYKNNKVKIESYEGFMRQVIGWRNYTYLIYRLERNRSQVIRSRLK